jgi:hypothetical protein
MRLRTSSFVLAGVLVASGGALAVASTETSGPGATTVTAAEPTPTADANGAGPSTPPGLAKKDKGDEHPGRGPDGQGPPGLAKKDETGEHPGRGPDGQGPPGQMKKDSTGEHPGRGPGGQGRGPDATGPAAYGLCEAWANQEDPAAKAERVPPFRNLAAAAGGVDKVDEYCAALPEREPEDDD